MKIGETVRVDRVHTLMRTDHGVICTDTSPKEAEAVARTTKLAKGFQLLKDAGHPVAFRDVRPDGRSLVLNNVDKMLPLRVTVTCNHATGLKVVTKGDSTLASLTVSLLTEMARGAFRTLRRAYDQHEASVTFCFGVGTGYMITHMNMDGMDQKVAVAA